MNPEKRVILILATCQALFQSAAILVMTLSSLVGQRLSSDPSLATLPIAANVLGIVIATIPASFLMGRHGRRPGFIMGALVGATGGAVSALGIVNSSFVVFCAGNLFIGAYQGFAQFYRFAAAEAASSEFRSRAISYVLAGGVVAAVVGPEIAKWTNDLAVTIYLAPYLVITALSVVAAGLLMGLTIPHVRSTKRTDKGRSLWKIVQQPAFVVALAGAAVGYGVMILAMTATPLAMVGYNHSVNDAAFVMQWHVLGMFVPSFFTGSLIQRFGVLTVMFTGTLLMGLHVIIACAGGELLFFLIALTLLGIGWNFLYIGGTTLLLEVYAPVEKAKVQALNDFLIHGIVVAASFSSGGLLAAFDWRIVNIIAVPFLAAAAILILALGLRRRIARASAS